MSSVSLDLGKLYQAADRLDGLAKLNEQEFRQHHTDEVVVGNTSAGMNDAWKLYGLEEGVDLSGSEPITGLNVPHEGLTRGDPTKVQLVPRPTRDFFERFDYFGSHNPVPKKAETLKMLGTGAPAQSILPWTPHPQHGSYSNNRQRNRTGVDKQDDIPVDVGMGPRR